jgi:hypothetical protein
MIWRVCTHYVNISWKKTKSGLTSKQITKLLGNQMGSHYFTNGVQFAFPTFENYSKLQSTGYFQKPYDELKKLIRSSIMNFLPPSIFGKAKNTNPIFSNIKKITTVGIPHKNLFYCWRI